jgi:hypothetical protein
VRADNQSSLTIVGTLGLCLTALAQELLQQFGLQVDLELIKIYGIQLLLHSITARQANPALTSATKETKTQWDYEDLVPWGSC